jgi:preprotein translocase subunit SecA
VFDYLKDRVAAGGRASRAQLRMRAAPGFPRAETGLLLRGLHFAIVDEADSILIDEARTPLILAEKATARRPAEACTARRWPGRAHWRPAPRLRAAQRAAPAAPDHRWPGPRRAGRAVQRARQPPGRAAHGASTWCSQALRALHLYQRDQHYLVAEDKVQIVDEYTGRILPGRTWEQGLHQMIETKEAWPLSEHNRTLARITYQRFFRRYLRLSGMTGTAQEVRREIWAVYRLEHGGGAPTNRPSRRRLAPTICCANEDAKWRRVAAGGAARARSSAAGADRHPLGRGVSVDTRC